MEKNKQKKLIMIGGAILVAIAILAIGGYFYNQNQKSVISAKYEKLIDEGDSFYQEHEYSEALNKYTEASEVDPTRSTAYYGMNFILLDKGLNDKALEVVESSKEHISKKDIAELNRQIAEEYGVDGNWEEANKYYVIAYDLDNDSELILKGLVLSHMKLGSIDNLEELISKIDSEDTEYSDLWSSYSDLLSQENGDLFTIVKESGELINNGYPYLAKILLEGVDQEKSAEYWEYFYFLGRANADIENYEQAIDSLEKALVLGTEDSGVYLLLARTNYLTKETDLAYQYYDKAFLFSEGQVRSEIGEEYVNILSEGNVNGKAQDIIETFSIISGDETIPVWVQVASLKGYIDREEYDLAEEIIANASVELSTNEDYLKEIAGYYIQIENTEKAKEATGSLKGFNIYSPEYYLLQAQINKLEGSPEDAKANLEKAIEYDLEGIVTPKAKIMLEGL